MWPKSLKYFFDQFGTSIPCSATYFLEVGAGVLWKVATKGSLRVKKLWKFSFLAYFSKSKTEKCDQKTLFFFDKPSMLIPCWNIYFLEVSGHVTLKTASKDYFRRKKVQQFSIVIAFFWAKTEECDQKDWAAFDHFGIIIPIITCSPTQFLEVGARVSMKVATKGSLRGKKTLKI